MFFGSSRFEVRSSGFHGNILSLPKNRIIKHLIVIAGPTASGKTGLSVSLAKHFNCSVVSADSRQFYKEMNIGTAKPSEDEMQGVPHYFVDSHSIEAPLNAGQFAREAEKVLSDLFLESNFVILVGGSGLFIKALIDGIDDLPGDDAIRSKWNAVYEKEGLSPLQMELEEKDPVYFNEVDKNNALRLIRALEVIELTGQTFSSVRKGEKKRNSFQTHYFMVNHNREKLYERINYRVDLMMKNGLEEEAKQLLSQRQHQALNTVGYKELFDLFLGLTSKEEAIAQIKQNSRRYAKRQITWFKQLENATWGTPEELHDVVIKKFKS